MEVTSALPNEGKSVARQERFKGPSDVGATVLNRCIQTMDVFARLDHTMPTSYVRMFLQVSRTPGKTISEYAEALGVYQAVSSRILLEIGPKARGGGKGLGLVDAEPSATDMRIKHYFLTAKGRKLYRDLLGVYGEDEIE